MRRVADTFRRAKQEGRAVLVGYLTAGDPDRATSLRDIEAAFENGVDILELGVPFSDPTADGPVIQEASQRALAAGMTVGGVLELLTAVRRRFTQPVILFGYANPFFRYGYAKLAKEAAAAGADGLLVVDIPMEEAGEIRGAVEKEGLGLVPLVAPTTPLERAKEILRGAKGFVYYIMVRGVTGARQSLAADAAEHLAALRQCTDLPVAAGFGISTAAQVRACAALADGVVVGSALVRAAREGRLAAVVRELATGLKRG